MKIFEFRLKFHWSLLLKVHLKMSALVQVMAWYRPGDNPLSDPFKTTHIYTIWPECFNAQKMLNQYLGPFLLPWFNSNPNMGSNHMPWKMWEEIIHPPPNYNGPSLGMDKLFHHTLYNMCGYLSITSPPPQFDTFSVSKSSTLPQEHLFVSRKLMLLPAHS